MRLKPLPKAILAIAIVGAFVAALHFGYEQFVAKKEAVKTEQVEQSEETQEPSALERASQAVKSAVQAAPKKAAPEPVQEAEPVKKMDASQNRGMKFLLDEGSK